MGKHGFSLMELMITIAIVGILAAIAIPSYTGYVTRTTRADAITALQTVALFEEKNMAENGAYTDSFVTLASVGLTNPNLDTDRNYNIAITVAGNTFIATATPFDTNFTDTIVFAIRSDGQVGRMNGAAFVADPDLWRSLRP